MKIGEIELGERPLFLAPMEDVTDPSFRFVCKEYGADVMFTEFVSSDGLIRDAKKAIDKLRTYPYERPIGIQIYGHIPEAMVEAAKIAEAAAPSFIDINFGCPVNKIARRGAGSGMMRYPNKMVQITKMVVESVKLPVTVKTRLGWDNGSQIICDLAVRLQDVGISALTIHGRTGVQQYKGEANWQLIGDIKNNPAITIPIIGNGDITTDEGAKEAFDKYGVDGVMIGRATYGRPWIFKEIKHYIHTGKHMDPLSLQEKVSLAKRHLLKSVEVKGDRVGVLEMRRHLSAYFKSLPDFKPIRMRLVTENSHLELLNILDYIEERYRSYENPIDQ